MYTYGSFQKYFQRHGSRHMVDAHSHKGTRSRTLTHPHTLQGVEERAAKDAKDIFNLLECTNKQVLFVSSFCVTTSYTCMYTYMYKHVFATGSCISVKYLFGYFGCEIFLTIFFWGEWNRGARLRRFVTSSRRVHIRSSRWRYSWRRRHSMRRRSSRRYTHKRTLTHTYTYTRTCARTLLRYVWKKNLILRWWLSRRYHEILKIVCCSVLQRCGVR